MPGGGRDNTVYSLSDMAYAVADAMSTPLHEARELLREALDAYCNNNTNP